MTLQCVWREAQLLLKINSEDTLASLTAWKCVKKAIKIGVEKVLKSKHAGSLVSDVNLSVASYFLSTKHWFFHFASAYEERNNDAIMWHDQTAEQHDML